MKNVVVISGVAGMTGSMVAKTMLDKGVPVVGFDNFFCGSRKVVSELEKSQLFHFFEYDINEKSQMDDLFVYVSDEYSDSEK